MADLSNYSFTGRLTRDAEAKTVAGKKLLEMNVANNIGYGDKQTTNWIKVSWWGDFAAGKADMFKKGTQITASGELKIGSYTGKDGNFYIDANVTVNSVQKLANPKDAQPLEQGVPEPEGDPVF